MVQPPTLLVSIIIVLLCLDGMTILSGKGLANPTALLLSSLMMLRWIVLAWGCNLNSSAVYFRHMNLNPYADKIEKAALTVRF
jgi:hypothetical protein